MSGGRLEKTPALGKSLTALSVDNVEKPTSTALQTIALTFTGSRPLNVAFPFPEGFIVVVIYCTVKLTSFI